MNTPVQSKTLSLVEAVREEVEAITVGSTVTVQDITATLRSKINKNQLTLLGYPFNSNLISKFWLPSGEFERQTLPYIDVRTAFVQVIDSMTDISWKLDSTNTFRLYHRDAPQTATGQTPSVPNIQTITNNNPSQTVVATSLPKVNPVVKSLAERVLEGSVTHKFNVILNGSVLKFNKQSTFFSKQEATKAVESRLAVLELTPKALAKEIKSLVGKRVLRFVQTKI